MIEFNNDLFVLSNSYYRYVMGVDKDGKLYHAGFFPAGSFEDIDYAARRNRLAHPYPFEALVNINCEPLQCSHGVRYFWSLSSFRALYHSHKIEFIDGGEKLTITLIDNKVNMLIHLVYEIYSKSTAIRRYTSVENLSSETILVNHISSFMLSNFPYVSDANAGNDLYLHRYKSHWAWEGSHECVSFNDLGLYKKWCRNGFCIESTSTWVCQDYIPYFAVEERDSGFFWGVQIEYSGPWRFETGCAEVGSDNWFYIQGGMGNDLHAQWHKTLSPGEVFTCPSCSLTTAKGRIEDLYNNMHTHQANVLIKHSLSDNSFPVIYNDWQYMFGQVNEAKILEQLDILKDCGVECYVTDAGWYTDSDPANPRSGWWNMTGDWEYDNNRFPNGLAYIAEQISERGMIPGIWCEIEAVGKFSRLYENGNLLMKRGDYYVEDIDRRFLYFGDSAGRDYATSVFERLIGYGFRYFKIDYNIDSAPGCTNSGDSLGQGLYEHRTGYYRWLDDLRKNHPDIIIENCSSGGMRLEYGMLTHTDLASITDQESNRYTGHILYNVTKLIHPSQCGNWSALKDSFGIDEYAYTIINSMMGRMHISGSIIKHTPEKQALLRKAIDFYKSYRSILKNPSVYYHTPDVKFEDNNIIIAYEYRSGDNARSVISASRLDTPEDTIIIRPENLIQGNYKVSSFPDDAVYEISGCDLYNDGLKVFLPHPYSSCIFLLELIK